MAAFVTRNLSPHKPSAVYDAGDVKRIMHYLLLFLIGYVLLTLFLLWREPSMIYFPDSDIATTPNKLGFQYEEVWLTTADGVKIQTWFLPAGTTNTPVVLFFHGNGGNLSHRFEKLNILRNLGVNTFIVSYRGYGQSEGKPNEAGTYADAQAAYTYLTGTRAVPARRIVAYGESLGAAVAIDLAAKVPVGGVIVEEAFTSVPDMAQRMFPFLPVRWLVRNRYDSLSKIAGIRAPLLAFHSRDDEVTAFVFGQRLFAAAREPEPKQSGDAARRPCGNRFVELTGNHNDAFLTSVETYTTALREFFAGLRQ